MTTKKTETETEMTPTDEGLEVQKAILAEMREHSRLKRLELGDQEKRRHIGLTAAGVPVDDAMAAANEEREAIADFRGPEARIPVIIICHTDDYGEIPVRAVLVGAREHKDERREMDGRSPRGEIRVRTITDWQLDEPALMIRKRVYAEHADTIATLEREGQKKVLAEVLERLEIGTGAGIIPVRHRVWVSLVQPSFNKLVGRLVPDLVASGFVKLDEPAAAA